MTDIGAARSVSNGRRAKRQVEPDDLDRLECRFEARFQAVSTRFAGVDGRFAALEDRLARLEETGSFDTKAIAEITAAITAELLQRMLANAKHVATRAGAGVATPIPDAES